MIRKLIKGQHKSNFMLVLDLSVKSMDETVNPGGLVLSGFLFREFPKLKIPGNFAESIKSTVNER